MDKYEKRFDKIDESLDKLDNKLDGITIVQVEQAKDIEHHIRRTDHLEALVIPITKSHEQLVGILNFFKVLAKIVAFLASILGFVKLLFHFYS